MALNVHNLNDALVHQNRAELPKGEFIIKGCTAEVSQIALVDRRDKLRRADDLTFDRELHRFEQR
jgi:hypothetical protein